MTVKELGDVNNKIVNYFVRISENIMIDNYENLFDTFLELKKYENIIFGLELNLSSKIGDNDFNKLLDFLQFLSSKLYFKLNLGNLEVFNIEQLKLLENMNSNLDIELRINQQYQGKYCENNDCDNLYSFGDLIFIKSKINKIINKIPHDYNDIEKILFLYKYLGNSVSYSDRIANFNYQERQMHDSNGIYDVLFKKIGVCSSIAVTFRVLMDAIGVESQVISSSRHEWNIIKIKDVWYHLDLTWDLDNIKSNNELLYFLKSERYMLKDSFHQFFTNYARDEKIAKKSLSVKKYIK